MIEIKVVKESNYNRYILNGFEVEQIKDVKANSLDNLNRKRKNSLSSITISTVSLLLPLNSSILDFILLIFFNCFYFLIKFSNTDIIGFIFIKLIYPFLN